MDKLVKIKSNRYGIDLQLDGEAPFQALIDALQVKFKEAARFFGEAQMILTFSGRRLTSQEEDQIVTLITELTKIEIVCIVDQEDENERTYRNILQRSLEERSRKQGEFYHGNLEYKQVLKCDSSIVIMGNVEFGAEVISEGNIIVMGTVFGSLHAGAGGNNDAYIAALSLRPKRLKIGDIEANRQRVYHENGMIEGPKLAVVDGHRIYVDPLIE